MTKRMLPAIVIAIAACTDPIDPLTPIAGTPYASSTCGPETCSMGTACGLQHDSCGGITWCGPCDCDSRFTTCDVALPPIAEVAW